MKNLNNITRKNPHTYFPIFHLPGTTFPPKVMLTVDHNSNGHVILNVWWKNFRHFPPYFGKISILWPFHYWTRGCRMHIGMWKVTIRNNDGGTWQITWVRVGLLHIFVACCTFCSNNKVHAEQAIHLCMRKNFFSFLS
jgi:hypothetical protein